MIIITCVTVIVLAIIVGYAIILNDKNILLEKSMTEYRNELKDVKEEVEYLRKEKQSMETKIAGLTSNLKDELRRLDDLTTDHYGKLLSKFNEASKEQKEDIDKRIGGVVKLLNDSNDQQSKENRKLQQKFDTLFSSSKSTSKDIEDIKSKVKDISSILTTDNTVAFYAFMGSSFNPGIHQPIIFNKVVTNVGGAYNGQTGMFTVPSSGVYVFSWVLFCYEGGYLRSALVVNKAVYGHVDTDSGSGRNFISATGVVVVNVKKGDVVYLRTDSKDGGILSTGDKRTQFSGWKLK